jgi:cyclopropane-fatty-acyl-phospholipid synthase
MDKTSINIDRIPTESNGSTAKNIAYQLLKSAGVEINGDQPWDIQVHDDRFYQRVLRDGPLGLGESYMDKWWDCERLDTFIEKALTAGLDQKVKIPTSYMIKLMLAKIINFQSKKRARQVAYQHYDLGNDLFEAMLDKRMIYSCAYFKDTTDLDEAQYKKLDLICKKLHLERGMRLLDIGCGWGGLAKFAAENYGVNVVGITISEQQHQYAKNTCKGLPIEIRLQDYRDIHEQFDRVVSVGMFEHVGHMNYDTYMQSVNRALKPGGLFLLHTIGVSETSSLANEWITTYIFPNGMLPSIAQIAKSAEKKFIVEDWHNFGAYYDNTLMAWHKNFLAHWNQLKSKYDERFYRMWNYYLLSCAGGFRARGIQLWQVMLSKNGVPGGYFAER